MDKILRESDQEPFACEILLIRHGRTSWNLQKRYQGHTDVPLDEVGQSMAQALAPRLREEGVHAIYSSDLRRARETALPSVEALGYELHLDWRLRECRFKPHEPDPTYPVLPFVRELETEELVLERAKEVMHEIARRHPGQRVAVVSHAGINLRFIRWINRHRPEVDHPVTNGNASITRLLWQDGQWNVLDLNDSAHLQAAGVVCSSLNAG